MVRKLVYPATLNQDGDYIFVEFPDVEGAFTQGADLEEAYAMAEEVLGVVLADQTEYPAASPLKKVAVEHPDKDVALIGVDLDAFRRKYRSKAVRRNITLPEWLNELVKEENINVSQIATDALREKLDV